MKILHIINNLHAGGAERLLLDMLPVLNSSINIKTDLLLLSDKDNVFESIMKEAGIGIFVCKAKRIKTVFNVFYIRSFLLKRHYDIVHVHLFPSIYWASLAKKIIFKKKIILIASEHNTYNRRRRFKIFHFIDKYIYKEFNYIICVSSKTELSLKKWLKVKENHENNFIVLENAVNVQKFKNAVPLSKEELIGPENNPKLVCMIGSFGMQKDQETLIKSMVYLNTNVHLLLVGQGENKKNMEKLVASLNLKRRVHFLGVRTDVERILKSSDIIALSSHWEGFGLVAVEGMAAGKPVIASNVDGLSEVVENAGLLFEKGNSVQFKDIVNKLLEDQVFYNEISIKCLERAQLYDTGSMVDKILKIYISLQNKNEIH